MGCQRQNGFVNSELYQDNLRFACAARLTNLLPRELSIGEIENRFPKVVIQRVLLVEPYLGQVANFVRVVKGAVRREESFAHQARRVEKFPDLVGGLNCF